MNLEQYLTSFSRLDDLFIMGSVWNTTPHTYGSDVGITQIEAHTLKFISENPDCIITDIADNFKMTRSGASRLITRLQKKNLIKKVIYSDNKKNIHFSITNLGKKVHECHQSFDRNYYYKKIQELEQHHSKEELDAFFQILSDYMDSIKTE